MPSFISKQELKYLFFASIFLIVFFVFIIPILSSMELPPLASFLIFNLSVVVFLQLFLKCIVTSGKKTLKGALGMMFLILGFSIISPPFSVNYSGVVNTNMFLGVSSTDFNLSQIYTSLGMSGYLLYLSIYIFSSIICFILSALLIKNFVEEL